MKLLDSNILIYAAAGNLLGASNPSMSQKNKFTAIFVSLIWVIITMSSIALAQIDAEPERTAEGIVSRAVEFLGGERYLQITSQVSRGKFSVIRDGAVVSFSSFHDVIVFPDRERTDFRSGKSRSTQVNIGGGGWVFDGDTEAIRDQTAIQLANFKRGVRTSLDNLLRGNWKGEAELTYAGRRPASLGRRNDVVKLRYEDGFEVEFEFSADDGTPQKAVYKRQNADGEDILEEDRFAQFVEVGGIRSAFVVDRFTDGKHASRINYESIEYNKRIPDSIFDKPANLKDAKRDIKL
jgi:hypothetical protein